MDTHKHRYDELDSKERNQFLQRARHNALLTIPSAMPTEGHHSSSHLVEAYQGLGALGVSNLANRMTMAMLPAGRPFMRLDLTPQARLESDGEVPADTEKQLALFEQLMQMEAEGAGWRDTTLMVMEQLIIAGTVLERQNEDNSLTVWRLDSFVCRFDRSGVLLEVIIEDNNQPDSPELADLSAARIKALPTNDKGEIQTYTRINLDPKKLEYTESRQDGNGAAVGKKKTYKFREMPYRVYRWSKIPGESYGRSKVEIHAGDLRSLESLEKSGLEIAAMAGIHFMTIRPGSAAPGIRSRLKSIQNGGTLIADPDAVDLKTFSNPTGMQIVESKVQLLIDRVSRAFLLLSGIRRDAERVTAEEIRADIDEIQNSVGGVFGTQATDMLQARLQLAMLQMGEQGRAPQIPDGIVSPTILTGLEALSREQDAARAMQGSQVVQAFGEEAVDVVKLSKLIGRTFIGLGMPDMVRSQEEADQRRAARQQQQQQAEVAKAAMSGAGSAAIKQGEQ